MLTKVSILTNTSNAKNIDDSVLLSFDKRKLLILYFT